MCPPVPPPLIITLKALYSIALFIILVINPVVRLQILQLADAAHHFVFYLMLHEGGGLFGLSRYLLVEYGENHLLSVEPEEESEFIAEIKKRQQS